MCVLVSLNIRQNLDNVLCTTIGRCILLHFKEAVFVSLVFSWLLSSQEQRVPLSLFPVMMYGKPLKIPMKGREREGERRERG